MSALRCNCCGRVITPATFDAAHSYRLPVYELVTWHGQRDALARIGLEKKGAGGIEARSNGADNNVSAESAETLLGGDQQASPHNTDAALRVGWRRAAVCAVCVQKIHAAADRRVAGRRAGLAAAA